MTALSYVAYFLYEINCRIKRECHSILECMYVFLGYVLNKLPQFSELHLRYSVLEASICDPKDAFFFFFLCSIVLFYDLNKTRLSKIFNWSTLVHGHKN